MTNQMTIETVRDRDTEREREKQREEMRVQGSFLKTLKKTLISILFHRESFELERLYTQIASKLLKTQAIRKPIHFDTAQLQRATLKLYELI